MRWSHDADDKLKICPIGVFPNTFFKTSIYFGNVIALPLMRIIKNGINNIRNGLMRERTGDINVYIDEYYMTRYNQGAAFK